MTGVLWGQGHRCACALIVATIAGLAHAYNFEGNDSAANSGRPRWTVMPVSYRFNNNTSASAHPNMVPGSTPRAAISQGMSEWATECAITFMSGADSVVKDGGINDGVNLMTFETTLANDAALNGDFSSGGFLGITLLTIDRVTNTIIDADIVFSSTAPFSTLGTVGTFSIRAIATHEIGHFIGLEHSAVWSATMWPYLGEYGNSNECENTVLSLTHDDRAGANQLYPISGFVGRTGAIEGIVRLAGAPVYGAHVVAINTADGIIYGANNTLGPNQGTKDGTYSIRGLPGGFYTVYAEPMDDPTSSANWTGNVSGGDWWGDPFTENFKTTYFGGNTAPSSVTVLSGTVQTANIDVDFGTPGINPQYAAYSATGVGFNSSYNLPLTVQPGSTRYVVIIGQGISNVATADATCSDPTMIIDPGFRVNGTTNPPWSFPYSIFRLTVPPGRVGGPRSISLRIGSEVAVFTGGLDIDGPELVPSDNSAIEWSAYE